MDITELKELRSRLGWTQEQVAEEVGVDPMTISRWERNVFAPKSRVVLKALDRLARRAERHQSREGGKHARQD